MDEKTFAMPSIARLLPDELAALDQLVEECAEVIHAAQKIKRFGILNFHPNRPEETNIDALNREMGDLSRAYAVVIGRCVR